MGKWEEVKYRAQPQHIAYAAMFFSALAAISMLEMRMSTGEFDIAKAYEPSLASAQAIDSHMGITEAQENIDLHEQYGRNWAVGGFATLFSGALGAWLWTRTTKDFVWSK